LLVSVTCATEFHLAMNCLIWWVCPGGVLCTGGVYVQCRMQAVYDSRPTKVDKIRQKVKSKMQSKCTLKVWFQSVLRKSLCSQSFVETWRVSTRQSVTEFSLCPSLPFSVSLCFSLSAHLTVCCVPMYFRSSSVLVRGSRRSHQHCFQISRRRSACLRSWNPSDGDRARRRACLVWAVMCTGSRRGHVYNTFIIVVIYRPGSEAVTFVFFDDQSQIQYVS